MALDYQTILHEEMDKVMPQISEYIQSYARANHRYLNRTGNLQKSTYTSYSRVKKRIEAYVDNNQADYGKYVAGGNGSWSGDDFLDEAIKANETLIDNYISIAMDESWERWIKQ